MTHHLRTPLALALLAALTPRPADAQAPPDEVNAEAAARAAWMDEEGNLFDDNGFPIEEGEAVPPEEGLQPVPRRGTGQEGGERQRLRPRVTTPKKKPPKPLEPTSFQQFVRANTGKLLPQYGFSAFDGSSDFAPPRTAPAPTDYTIGPGDEILLSATGVVDLNLRLPVDRGGRITLPKVGAVSVAGVRAAELESFLERQLAKSFRNFRLSATLGALRSIDIYVVGEARTPGRHTVSSLASFVNAIFLTAGPNGNGGVRHIALVREGKNVAEIDLYQFLTAGTAPGDVRLLPGDTIVYPRAGARVALLGEVNSAGVFELAVDGESIGDLLRLAGGVPVTATRRRASVERIDPAASIARSVESVALDDAGIGRALQDGDIITLLPISPEFKNAVTLRGNVATPLRYAFQAGMRIRDLIPDRDALINPDYYKKKNLLVQFDDTPAPKPRKQGEEPPPPAPKKTQQTVDVESARHEVHEMLDKVNWAYAVVERLNKATLTTDLLPFHLGKAVLEGDPTHNLALQPGDIVTVFSEKDLAVPQASVTRLVRVEGEVRAPGVYQLRPGETLPMLLERVGGTTEQAYLYGLALKRDSVRRAQAATLDRVVRQLDAELRASIAERQANLSASGDPAQVAAFQQQLQQQEKQARERLDLLRAAVPDGRVALELDPEQPALPALALEDGDAILVPSRPSFVTVVGSVHNENGLVWKKGRTVGDYLAAAGSAPNADLDNLYVLRADGSVRSRDRGLFAWMPAQNHGLELEPGDVVIVPERLDLESGYTMVVRGLRDWTQILANMGIAVATVALLYR
ncbi:MAG: SLBB domain-containing protein [Deltaproteobacteria bacterium]|nr:SLBB domain-containing protein [Deltaproteobacteria bacterium]